MPIKAGKKVYKDFAACQAGLAKKYGASAAKKICGKLQHLQEASIMAPLETEQQVTQLIDAKKSIAYKDEKGELWIKTFLIDESVNINDWGVKRESIPKRVHSVMGKPAVLYMDRGDEPDREWHRRVPGMYNHPPITLGVNGNEDIRHVYEIQAPFTVGNVKHYDKDKDGKWYAYIHVTDAKTREAFESDPDLPFFTSVSVWNRNQKYIPEIKYSSAGIPYYDWPEDREMDDWEIVHIAFVDNPAFGVDKAYIRGTCTGDGPTCIRQLKYASVSHVHGDPEKKAVNCGFCPKVAMQKLASNVRNSGLADIALGRLDQRLQNNKNDSSRSTAPPTNSLAVRDMSAQLTENVDVGTKAAEGISELDSAIPNTNVPENNELQSQTSKQPKAQNRNRQSKSAKTEELDITGDTENSDVEYEEKVTPAKYAALKDELALTKTQLANITKEFRNFSESIKKQQRAEENQKIAVAIKHAAGLQHLAPEMKQKYIDRAIKRGETYQDVLEFLEPLNAAAITAKNARVAAQKIASVNRFEDDITSNLNYGPPTASDEEEQAEEEGEDNSDEEAPPVSRQKVASFGGNRRKRGSRRIASPAYGSSNAGYDDEDDDDDGYSSGGGVGIPYLDAMSFNTGSVF